MDGLLFVKLGHELGHFYITICISKSLTRTSTWTHTLLLLFDDLSSQIRTDVLLVSCRWFIGICHLYQLHFQ